MIPLQLHIKNFLSYGATPQTISFDTHGLLCLSGRNGHGKSALLDALTWAIWGQARKLVGTSRSDEYLIRLGQTHMAVSADVLCEGVRYRIHRECTLLRGRAQVEVHFGICSDDGSHVQSLDEPTSRATQQKIVEVLGLTYETFINSVYLRQGQSNEFSKKSPRERKELLATILGLSSYASLYEKASARAKLAQLEYTRLDALHTHLLQATMAHHAIDEQRTQLEEHLTRVQTEHTMLTKEHANLQTRHNSLCAEYQTLERAALHREKYYTEYLNQFTAYCRSARRWRTERAEWSHASKNQSGETAATTIQDLEHKLTCCTTARTRMLQIKEEIARAERTIANERATQETLLKEALSKALHDASQADLSATHAHSLYARAVCTHETLVQSLQQAQADYAKAHAASTASTAEESLFERRKTLYQHIRSRITAHHALIARTKHSMEHMHMGKACITCNQLLTTGSALHAHKTAADLVERLSRQNDRMQRWLQTLTPLLHEQRERIQALREQGSQASWLSEQAARLTTECTEALYARQTAELSVHAAQATHAKAQDQAQKARLMYEQRQDTAIIRTHIDVVNKLTTEYTAAAACAHEEESIRAELARLVHTDSHAVRAHLTEQRATLRQLAQACKAAYASYHHAMLSHETMKSLKPEIDGVFQELSTTAQSLTQLQNMLHDLTKQLAHIAAQQAVRDTQKDELARVDRDRAEQARIQEEFHSLAHVLGKDGIQALLIEEALPELEDEANALLARITDNQAHIHFESLKDLKSGKTKETLDISISDAAGIRSYDLFSGGEAFRIDFALRIALSKLLARRSGTSLQTLIIDEGFGSQDEQGIEALMDALKRIQDDFAKIIIVSHLSSMKEQIGTHILIEKTSAGSCARIVEYDVA